MSRIENLEQTFSLKKIDNEPINIKIHNNEILISLVGEFNKPIKKFISLVLNHSVSLLKKISKYYQIMYIYK